MKRRSGWQPYETPYFHSRQRNPKFSEWTSQEQPGSGSTASALVSDISAPSCTNGRWPLQRPVSVVQKNKPSSMLSSNIRSINLLMDWTTRWFWTMRQSICCSTPVSRSSKIKQCIEELDQTTKKMDKAKHFNKHNTQLQRIWETPLNQNIRYSNLQSQNWTESCKDV